MQNSITAVHTNIWKQAVKGGIQNIEKLILTHQNRCQPLHSSERLKNIRPAGRGKINAKV